MINKYLVFAVVLAVGISLGKISTSSNANNAKGIIISSGKNFIVYDITKDNQLEYSPEYKYEIYDRNGKIVKSAIVWRINPDIDYVISDTLLYIRISVGTGTFLMQYYDICKDTFSQIFESPALAGFGRVVYMGFTDEDGMKLVVRDIFNESLYYREYRLDFSPTAIPADALQNAEFLDENTIRITYLSGDNYIEKEAVLHID